MSTQTGKRCIATDSEPLAQWHGSTDIHHNSTTLKRHSQQTQANNLFQNYFSNICDCISFPWQSMRAHRQHSDQQHQLPSLTVPSTTTFVPFSDPGIPPDTKKLSKFCEQNDPCTIAARHLFTIWETDEN